MSLPRNQRRVAAKQAAKSTKTQKADQAQDRVLGIKESAVNALVQIINEVPTKYGTQLIQVLQGNLFILEQKATSPTKEKETNE